MFERGAECGDGDACTTGGTCTDGACVGIAPKDCDDNNSCTEDRCDAGTGCVHEALGDVVCDDGNACTEDECRKAEGCAHEPLSGQPCSDGDLCTDDACGAVSGCTHTPNGGSAAKCDGLDNDCDGSVDEQCSFPNYGNRLIIAEDDVDSDGDGLGLRR